MLAKDGLTSDESEAVIRGLQATPVAAPGLSAGERALLAYADRLTIAPWQITAADVDRLRGVGYDDRAIHDACAIVAYFAFVNRIADGLGVDLEPRFRGTTDRQS